jgi:NADH:ubiquinone oxidoreductase subunit 3 (subunit A)
LGYSYKLQQLNNQLTDINNQMKNLSKSNYAEYDKNNQTSKNQEKILKTNYETLVQEKSEIEEMIKKYETVNTSYEDGSVNVTSNYYIYIIFLFIVIFLIIFLLTYSFKSSTEQRGGGKYFNFNTILYLIFLGIVVVFNASIKK